MSEGEKEQRGGPRRCAVPAKNRDSTWRTTQRRRPAQPLIKCTLLSFFNNYGAPLLSLKSSLADPWCAVMVPGREKCLALK